MKKYRTIKPFIAFGKTADRGELVWLSDDQAEALEDNIAPYEVKVEPAPPEIKKKDTPSASSRRVRAPRKKTLKSSKKSVTK